MKATFRFQFSGLATLALLALIGCGSGEKPYTGAALPYTPEPEKPKEPDPKVLLVTNHGEIELELWEDEAPNTVGNFISLIESKFYDGLTFHRIIKDFMIQGGDPQGTGMGGPGYKFPDEVRGRDEASKLRANKIDKYVLAMANSGPNTNGSQFFIMTGTSGPRPDLDLKHTVFGKVTKGTETVDKIAAVPTEPGDRPKEKVIIQSAKVISKRNHPYVVRYKQVDEKTPPGMPPGLSFGQQSSVAPPKPKIEIKKPDTPKPATTTPPATTEKKTDEKK
ncbi:MAG TPA: peptidylprolyl isomerase [Planctomycetota bacterium]|nr:peptidylprolyl isomerase [Planctomycetota bacterium]